MSVSIPSAQVVSASISLGGGVASGSWYDDVPDQANKPDAKWEAKAENEKECVIYVIDACSDMIATGKFQDTLEAVICSIRRKIIQNPDDKVGIILYNTKDSKDCDAENISVLSGADPSINCPTPPLLLNLKQLKENPPESLLNAQVDFFHVLKLVHDLFQLEDPRGNKYGSKRVFFFTRNDNPRIDELIALKQKRTDMLYAGCELNVFPLVPEKLFSLGKFWKYILSVTKDEYFSEKTLYAQCRTLDDLKDALRVKEFKKRCLTSVPFQINGEYAFAVKLYAMRNELKVPTPIWLDPGTNEQLTTHTQFVCADTGASLSDDQYTTFLPFGDQEVPFTKKEMGEMKHVEDPCLRLFGFKPRARLKPYHQIKPAYFVYPDEEWMKGSSTVFRALQLAMAKSDKVAICRFNSRVGSIPRFVALSAQLEEIDEDGSQKSPPGFNLHFLPYADDIRKITVPAMRSAVDDDELINRAKAVVKVLHLQEGLPELSNPAIQKLYDCCEAIALGEELPESKDETTVSLPTVHATVQPKWDEFRAVLPEPQVKSSKKRKAPSSNGGGRAKKKVKQEVKEEGPVDWKKLAQTGALKKKKVKELKAYLEANGLSKTGNKGVLVERIENHLGVHLT